MAAFKTSVAVPSTQMINIAQALQQVCLQSKFSKIRCGREVRSRVCSLKEKDESGQGTV